MATGFAVVVVDDVGTLVCVGVTLWVGVATTVCETMGCTDWLGVVLCVGAGLGDVGATDDGVDVGLVPPDIPGGLMPPTIDGTKVAAFILVMRVAVYLPPKSVNPSHVLFTCCAYHNSGAGLSMPPHDAMTELDGTCENGKPTKLPL